jgi:hypothetical protein
MTKDQVTLACVSIALALVTVLLARLPRPVLLLVITSVVGGLTGVLMLLGGRVSTVICDYVEWPPPGGVDGCSGTYIGDVRLPQFMQGHADAWLIGTAALLGVLLADLVALGAMWAWARLRRSRSIKMPQEAGTAISR